MATYTGTAGNDSLGSTSGDDQLSGLEGDDSLYGGKGWDVLVGGPGNDLIDGGGDSSDRVVFTGGIADYAIDYDAATRAWTVRDLVPGRDGIDRVTNVGAFQFADTVVGSWWLEVSSRVGGTGDDYLIGSMGKDSLRGGAGNDTLYGGKNGDTLVGGAGDDWLIGGTNDDYGQSEDTARFSGLFEEYLIRYDSVSDRYTVIDTVAGRDGTDTVSLVETFEFADGIRTGWLLRTGFEPSAGNDLLTGTDGADSLAAAAGSDTLQGGDGDDTLQGGLDDDQLLGGAGVDVAVFQGNASEYTVLYSELGEGYLVSDSVAHRDGGDGVAGVEYLQFADGLVRPADLLVPGRSAGTPGWLAGTALKDWREGGAGDDLALGLGGDDVLSGGGGRDTLSGGVGDDVLAGDAGDDLLDGGAGVDVARFAGARAGYALSVTRAGFQVVDLLGDGGTDQLQGIERIRFGDVAVAFDLDGQAGAAVRVLGAVFGPGAASNRSAVAAALALQDQGMSEAELMQFALVLALGDHAGNAAVVDLLYANVVGAPPPPEVRAQFVALIEQGAHTQLSLALLAAGTAQNLQNIGFAGLGATGVDYA